MRLYQELKATTSKIKQRSGKSKTAITILINFRSSGYGDELTWAAVWIYKATEENKYLEQAEIFYSTFRLKERPNEFFYNKKVAGLQASNLLW